MSPDKAYYEQDMVWSESRSASDRERSRIDETLSLIPSDIQSVVDLGAGNGSICNALASQRPDLAITAVDWSETALQQVKVKSICANIAAVPLESGDADLVMSCEVLEHLSVDDYAAVLREIARLSGKYILITVPNEEELCAAKVTCPFCHCDFHRFRHCRSFTRATMADLLDGFDAVTISMIGPPKLRLRRFTNYIKRRWKGDESAFRQGAKCPQCGYGAQHTGSNDQRVEGNFRASRETGRWRECGRKIVKHLLENRKRRAWVAALYCRRSPTDQT